VQPQGGSFAYGACARKNSCQLVVNDKPASDEYENISPPKYSDDGKHLGFCGSRKKESHIVVDGRDAGPQVGYHDPNQWGFDKTGRLYSAVSTNFKWTYLIGDLHVSHCQGEGTRFLGRAREGARCTIFSQLATGTTARCAAPETERSPASGA
jgi:hypothetical protein